MADASRSAASASASSSATRSRSGATRARASSTTAPSSPSRSAIRSACDVPGRPTETVKSGAYVSGSKPVAAFSTPSVELAHSLTSA